MNPIFVGTIVFVCMLGGTFAGLWLRSRVPAHHLTEEARDTVKLSIGLVATMTALVLGLVTASAKSTFDAVDSAVKHTAMDILILDRALARYGPETDALRGTLQRTFAHRLEQIWPQGASRPAQLDPVSAAAASGMEGVAEDIRGLTPRDDAQRALQTRALTLAEALLQARWLVFAGGSSIPLPFFLVLLFWLTITFAGFGLLAPRNGTVLAVLFVCALSVGGAVFLILEMDEPFAGVVQVSAAPLRYAHAHLNQ